MIVVRSVFASSDKSPKNNKSLHQLSAIRQQLLSDSGFGHISAISNQSSIMIGKNIISTISKQSGHRPVPVSF